MAQMTSTPNYKHCYKPTPVTKLATTHQKLLETSSVINHTLGTQLNRCTNINVERFSTPHSPIEMANSTPSWFARGASPKHIYA